MSYFTGTTDISDSPKTNLNSAPPKKKGGARVGWLLKNTNTISSILILVVCSFILFVAEFNLDKASVGQNAISVTMVILLFATYTLYINGFGIGKEKNDLLQVTKDVYDEYNKQVKKIRDEDKLLILDDFREHYIATELKETKEAMLQSVDLCLRDYDLIKTGDSKLVLTKKQQRVVKQVSEVKPIRLTRQMILSCRPYSIRRNPIKDSRVIEASKFGHFATKFVSATITSMFAVSIGADLILSASWETIISSIVKVSLLLFTFFSGMKVGKKYSEAYVDRTRDILGLLEEFDDFIKTRPTS